MSQVKKQINKSVCEEIEIKSIRFTIEPPSEDTEEQLPVENDKKINPSYQIPTFNIIAQDFITILQMLWKYMNSIGSVAQRTSFTNLASLPILLEEITESEKERSKDEKALAMVSLEITIRNENGEEEFKNIKANVYEPRHLKSLDEFRQYHDTALRILNETALQQIVNAYEKVIGEVLAWHLYTNPDAAPKDKEINYKDLLSFSSFEEAKRYVIDKEIENFLKRKSTEDQLKYLKKELKADIACHFKPLSVFKEVMLRRHAIVHAGGIATAEYLRRAKKIKACDVSGIEEGTKLPLNAKYVIDAWNVTYSMGVILLHLVAKECARSKKSKEDEDQADCFLINSSFNCIQNKQYDASEFILRYAHKLRLAKDTSNLMVVINLAQTLRWKGKVDECEKLLNKHDWNAYSALFQLCVAALQDDAEKFETLLPDIAAQKTISITELCEWPVFRLMRARPNFEILVEKAFGESTDSVTDLFKPKLINISPAKRLTALIEYLGKDQTILEQPDSTCTIMQ